MSGGQLKGNRKTENGTGVYHSLNVNVPDHWKTVALEQVLDDIIGGGTPSKANPEYWVGSIPWLTVKDMRTRRPEDAIDHIAKDAVRDSATNIIPAGTVIIATRIGLGKVIRVPYDAAINQDLKALVAKPGLENGYLEYWILSIAEYLESIGSGTTVKGIRLEQLRSLPFPLAPLNEQKRIVAEIDKQFSRLDEAVANLKRVKANLKRYKAAVLKAALEGKLTEDWREQHPDVEPASKLLERILVERRAKQISKERNKVPARTDTSTLSVLPNGWIWCSTDVLFSYVTSGSRGWAKHYSAKGPLFLRIGNLDHDSIRLDLKYIQRVKPPKGAEGTRTKVEEGDILVSITADVGMIAVAPHGLGEAYINQHVALARPVLGICREYLAWYLASRDGGQKQFRQLQRGATKVGLGLDDIRAVSVPLPPLAEQKSIVAEVERRLSGIEKLDDLIEASLKRSEHVRRATLIRAFDGKLVSANPSDEPANVLLDRLRARKGKASETLPIEFTEVAMVKRRVMAKDKQPIVYVLKQAKRWLSTADLLTEAGYPRDTAPDEMEAFYLELKKELQAVPRTIEIERRNDFDYFRVV